MSIRFGRAVEYVLRVSRVDKKESRDVAFGDLQDNEGIKEISS